MMISKPHSRNYALLFCLGLLVTTAYVKNRFKRTECMKELHSKYIALMFCRSLHLLYVGDFNVTYRPSDVYITTVGRSGTHLAMNYMHQIRSKLDHNFDICHVAPLVFPYMGLGKSDVNSATPINKDPRMYFGHALHQQLPAIGKFIFVIRNPLAVIASWSDFLRHSLELKDRCSSEDVYFNCIHNKCSFPGTSSIWNIYANWWQQLKQLPKKNRLWIHYEDLISHKRDALVIQMFARIMGHEVSTTLIDAIKERTTLDYARTHQLKFNCFTDHAGAVLLITSCQSNEQYKIYNIKTNYNMTGLQMSNRTIPKLSESLRQLVKKKWTEYLTPITGFETYDDMLQTHLKMLPGEMSDL